MQLENACPHQQSQHFFETLHFQEVLLEVMQARIHLPCIDSLQQRSN